MKRIIVSIIICTLIFSCKSNHECAKETVNKPITLKQENKRLNPEELMTKMDKNADGSLSKDEVKGPLAKRFSIIDINNDGFLTKEELTNAPKPNKQFSNADGQ